MSDMVFLFLLSAMPIFMLTSWILIITLKRKATLDAAQEVWKMDSMTVLELPNGDLHLWLERRKGFTLLLSGAFITLFSVPLLTLVLPVINLKPLADVLGGYLSGLLIGLPLWLTLGGLVPLTFGAEWFEGSDFLISRQSRTITSKSFFLQFARTWNFTDFFGLRLQRQEGQTSISLNFKNHDVWRKNLALVTVPAGHAEQALSILRTRLGMPVL